MIYLKGNRWLTIFAAELTGSLTKIGWSLELTCCSIHHVSQGNGPVPLHVGVRIKIKSTNVVLHNSSSDKYAAKTHKALPVELLQLNSQYDTDQDRFSVVRRTLQYAMRFRNKVTFEFTLKWILATTIHNSYRNARCLKKSLLSNTIFF